MNEERLSGAFCVYYLLSEDGALLYIGRSQRPSYRKWCFERKHGIKTVLGISQRHATFEDACAAERAAISKHRPPYNQKLMSARGMQGQTHNETTKRAIGDAHRGKTLSAETRAKMSTAALGRPSAFKGRTHTEETRQMLREISTGKKHSTEARARMSATRKGMPSPLKGRQIGPHKNKRVSA